MSDTRGTYAESPEGPVRVYETWTRVGDDMEWVLSRDAGGEDVIARGIIEDCSESPCLTRWVLPEDVPV